MGAVTQKDTLLFITVLLLLCYSVRLTSGGFGKIIKNVVKVAKNINDATGCHLCYVPCEIGCKKVFDKSKSSTQFDSCIKVCKKTCKCEL
jgi:hypothetical protein